MFEIYRRVFVLGLPLILGSVSFTVSAEKEVSVSTGTAWVVAPHFVVTNNHVVENASTVTLVRTDNKRIIADVVLRDSSNDIALLKPRKMKLLPPGLPIASKTANVGATIFTIGYPLVSIMGREPKLTTGYVNARTGLGNDPRTYQISVPIQPGNSGGPVLNMRGEVIGIATSSLNAAKVFNWAGNIPQNVNYAVKSHYVNALLGAVDVNHKHEVKTLESRKEELESLVTRVKASVLLVIARDSNTTSVEKALVGADPVSPAPAPPKSQSPGSSKPGSKQKFSLIVYIKPSTYDMRWSNTTYGLDHSPDAYSRSVANFMVKQIKKYSHATPERIISGEAAYRPLYQAYDREDRSVFCTKDKVDFLFSAKNEPNANNQDITYYVYGCKSNEEYYYSQALKENRNDNFLYEKDLKKKFRNMFKELPPEIGLSLD